MSALEIWTRVAIWILLGGSVGVFVWFARDLIRLGSLQSPDPAAAVRPGQNAHAPPATDHEADPSLDGTASRSEDEP